MLRPHFVAVAFTAALGIAASAQTEETPAPLPLIEVTGTHLGRPLAAGPAPATVITRAEIERSAHTSLADLLRELPEVPTASINDAVAISTTRGVVAADLRGLGAGNTLVLVNGRRTTVSANASDTTTFVDLNRFPPGLLERVEILKGGASAIYGSDAVAGVINLITRRHPSGGEARVSYGNTFSTDTAELEANLAVGATHGPLAIAVGADFSERHALANRDRDFSRTANLAPRFAATYAEFAALPADQLAGYDGRSLTAPNARVLLNGGQVNGTNGVSLPGLAAGAPITALPGTGGVSAGTLDQATPSYLAPFREPTGGQFNAAAAATFGSPETTRTDPAARNLFNFNDYIWLVPDARRAGINARLDFAATPGLSLFGELSAQHNRSHTEFQPVGIGGSVPHTNPYNPFGVDVTAVWRIADAGPRKSVMIDDAFSALVGARSPAGTTLGWETAASYSRDEFTDTTTNAMSTTRVLNALASTDRATALNPFGGESFRHDPALVDSLRIKSWFAGWADLLSFDAKLTRDLVEAPAGPITAVAYVEHRRDRFNAFSDSASQAGDVLGQGGTGPDAQWTRDATALAAEARAPVLPGPNGKPLLSIEAAVRDEVFPGSFHSGLRPSGGVVAQPSASLLLRASEAWTFRAPTLPQLYAPQSDGYANSMPDPRRPATLTGDPTDGPNVSRLMRSGGNPDLTAETGRVLQAGAVWEPRAMRGLTIDTTWFHYEIENVITGVGGQYVLQHELGGLGALVHRDPGSEIYVNRTSAPIAVLTGPNGATSQIGPGQSATVPGRLQRVDGYIVNLSRRRLVGWDIGAHQVLDSKATGHWTLGAAASYTVDSSYAYDRYSPLVSHVGAAANPRWRGRATLDWERQSWAAGATFLYTASSGAHADLNYMKPYRVVHLRLAWNARRGSWLHGAEFSVGINDLFNESVPLYNDPPVGYQVGAIARPQGRFWHLAVKQTW